MTADMSDSNGGAGGNLLMTVLAVEELSAVDASVAIFVDVQNTLVNTLLRKWASDDVKRRYLPRLASDLRSEEHTSELQSRGHLVCRLLLEKKKKTTYSMQ